MIQRRGWFLLGGLLAGWLVDLLFWNTYPVGMAFPLWVIAAVAIGFGLLYGEGLRPSRWSWLLAGLAVLFAVLSTLRQQGFSSMISALMSLYLLALLVATLRNGNWLHYRMMDTFIALMRVALMALAGMMMLFTRGRPKAETPAPRSSWREKLKPAAPVLRGLLLALPVLLVLGGLLVAADPIFGESVERMFSWLRIENLDEFFFRAFYVLCIAYVMVGLYFHAAERDEPRPDPSRQEVKPFLGFIETSVVLGLVNLMFLLFVGIQFIYLFGGQANITAAGYTYAEYARRGFFELVAVAVLSLMLYLTLGYITKRETGRQKRIFTGLVAAELLLVMVMLFSAFQRMALYQEAYGFSELRVQVNVLMIWLGILLVATIVLEILRRSQHFGLAALLFCIGFVFTMGVFNMDAFIVEQNVARARQGAEFDAAYLQSLSDDATPAIYAQFSAPDLPRDLKEVLGSELACRGYRAQLGGTPNLLSVRFSQQAAYDLLNQHQAEWQQYECVDHYRYSEDW